MLHLATAAGKKTATILAFGTTAYVETKASYVYPREIAGVRTMRVSMCTCVLDERLVSWFKLACRGVFAERGECRHSHSSSFWEEFSLAWYHEGLTYGCEGAPLRFMAVT